MRMFMRVVLCLCLLVTGVEAALVSNWAFDEGSLTTAVDSVGGNTLTLSTASWAAPKLGNSSIHLDTAGPIFATFAAGVARNKTNMTVAFWVKPASMTLDSYLVYESTAPDAGTIRFAFGLNATRTPWCGGRRSTADVSGSARFLSSTETIPIGVWTHVACVWDGTGGTLAIYINGAIPAANFSGAGTIGAFATTASAALPRLGRDSAGTGNSCICDMDALQVYDTALTQAQVQALYALGTDLVEIRRRIYAY